MVYCGKENNATPVILWDLLKLIFLLYLHRIFPINFFAFLGSLKYSRIDFNVHTDFGAKMAKNQRKICYGKSWGPEIANENKRANIDMTHKLHKV